MNDPRKTSFNTMHGITSDVVGLVEVEYIQNAAS